MKYRLLAKISSFAPLMSPKPFTDAIMNSVIVS